MMTFLMVMKVRPASFFLLFYLLLISNANAHKFLEKEFDHRIKRIKKDHRIPGMAVGIINDGKVVYKKCFGKRDLKKGRPVTSQTVFPIGSLTKSFTSTGLMILLEQKKMGIKAKVKAILPQFELQNKRYTQKISLKDLLTHRSGISEDVHFWYRSHKTTDELFHLLRKIPYKKGLWGHWNYSNMGYVVIGQVIEKISQKKWEIFLENALLKKLKMDSTFFSQTKFNRRLNHAKSYSRNGRKSSYVNIDAVAAAGGIHSNLEDMLRWLSFHINEGELDQKRLVSRKIHQMIIRSYVELPAISTLPKADFGKSGYGLGWFIENYKKNKLVWHTGGHNGYTARIGFLPHSKSGFVILTNREDAHTFTRIVGLKIVDLLTEKE